MRTNVRSMSSTVVNSFFPQERARAGLFLGVALWCLASLLGAATVNVDIKDSFFSPSSVIVNPGDTVLWTNLGAISHTSTSGSGCTADGKWNSGTLNSGASFSFTFTTSGSFPYFCKFHCASGMKGTITVSGSTALSCSVGATPTSGSAPLMVNFSGSATGGSSPYSFAWVFGDGGSAGGASVSHSYSSAGNYDWTLTVTDNASATCTKTGTITVTSAASLSCSASATPTSGNVPLTVGFTGTAAGGATPYTFAWAFGDGTFGSGASLSHIYSTAGTFNWTLTVTDGASATCASGGSVTAGTSPAYAVFLASAARATGAQGTNWKTDAMFYNGGSTTVNYTLYYTPSGTNGTSTSFIHSGTVTPGGAPVLDNFIETLFGLTNSAGSVRITSDGTLNVSARIYNDTGNGTYGQWLPGQTLYDAVPPPAAARAAVPAELIGINEDSDYRTNIGFSEIGGLAASVLVNVFDDQNTLLAQNIPVALLPYSYQQMHLTDLGGASGDDLRVQIINQGPGTVLAFSSVVDNHTGDAVFVPAQKDSDVTGETHQLVAVIAKASGAFNTNWVSDLYLYNPLGQAQNVALHYTATQGSFSASLPLQGSQLKPIHDVVADLFPNAGSSTSGSLQILSDNGLIIVSRTYNQTSSGTYGQLVPEFNSDDPIGVGDATNLLQVANNADFRTNVGFSEYSGMDTLVSATLYDSGGNVVASTTSPLSIPASGNVQIRLDQLFVLPGLVDSGEIKVTVASGGSVYPYISVVDNRTGDAICVPGKK